MNKNKLYKNTVKLARETNKRLKRLEKGIDINKGRYNPKTKRFERVGTIRIVNKKGKRINLKTKRIVSYKSGTWASKKLYDKIGDYINNNQITVPTNANRTQLISLNKAMRNFLDSKTSTISGIIETEELTKNNISNLVNDFDSDLLDKEDIETLYSFFEDDDFKFLTQTCNIPPSDLFILLTTAKREDWSSDRFISEIENYISDKNIFADYDLKGRLEKIYNKFVL